MIKAKLRFIDCLRGIAIFAVLIRHLAGIVDIQHKSPGIFPYFLAGQYGVQLFFVVSAFTLFLSLDRRRANETRPWRNYFIRRFFRIAPMFWAALAFYYCFPNMDPGVTKAYVDLQRTNFPAVAATACFVNGSNPHWINSIVPGEWSVATEMLFYLLVPLFFLTIRNLRTALIAAVVIATGAFVLNHELNWRNPMIHPEQRQALRQVYVAHTTVPENLQHTADVQELWQIFLYFWLPNQLPIFALGIVLYYLFHAMGEPGRRTEENARANAPPRWLSYLLLLMVIAIAVWIPKHEFRHIPTHIIFGVAAVLLGCSLAIYQIPLLVNGFWQYLGKISYSVYLTHCAIMWGLARWLQPTLQGGDISFKRLWLIFVLEVPLAMLVGTATYYLIEERGIDLGRRLIQRLEARSVPEPALAA